MTAQISKVKDAQPMGEYQQTSLDLQKKEVDFLLVQVAPFVIRWKNGGSQIVTSAKLKKLQAAHTWLTDF
jgi:hypothetical protein